MHAYDCGSPTSATAGACFNAAFDDDADEVNDNNFPAYIDGVDDITSLGPFKVTSKATVLNALTTAQVGPGDVIVDLGSGDGRFCTAAVQCFQASGALGIEMDPQLVSRARQLAAACNASGRTHFLCQDLTRVTLQQLVTLLASIASAAGAATCQPSLVATPCCPCSAGLVKGAATSAEQPASDKEAGLMPRAMQQTGVVPSSLEPAGPAAVQAACGAAVGTTAGDGHALHHVVLVVYLLPQSEHRFKALLLQLYHSGARIIAIHWPLEEPGLYLKARGTNCYVYQQ